MIKSILGILLLILCVTAFTTVAVQAQETPSDAGSESAEPADPGSADTADEGFDFGAIVQDMIKAYKGGNWALVALLLLIAGIGATRRFSGWASKKYDKLAWAAWFGTRWGGWTLNAIAAFAGGLIPVAGAGGAVTWAVISSAIMMGLSTAGGMELFKDFGKSSA